MGLQPTIAEVSTDRNGATIVVGIITAAVIVLASTIALRTYTCKYFPALQQALVVSPPWLPEIDRFQHRRDAATRIQTTVRGWRTRRAVDLARGAACIIGKVVRGWLTRGWVHRETARIVALPAAVTKIKAIWLGMQTRRRIANAPYDVAVSHMRSLYESTTAARASKHGSGKRRSGNRKPRSQCVELPTMIRPDFEDTYSYRATYYVVYLLFPSMKPMADFTETQVKGLQNSIWANMEEIESAYRGKITVGTSLDCNGVSWIKKPLTPLCLAMAPMYLALLMRATWEQTWRLRYSAAPPTHVTLFARHFNRWLIALHQKIAQGRGLLIPPGWVWDGWDDCTEDLPEEFFRFDRFIKDGIYVVDRRFAVDHFGDLLDAEVDGDLDHDVAKASSDQDSDDEDYPELDHGGA